MDFAIGGVGVAVLIVGIVEMAKQFGVTGRWSQVLALVLGIILTGLAYGLSQGLIPPWMQPYIEWGVTAVAGGLAAMGYYDLGKRFFSEG